jgi:hypothetical protein
VKRLVLAVTLGCLYFCGVNAIGQIYCDEKGTCYLNPEWLIKKGVPEVNKYPEFIIATPVPTIEPTTNLCYDEDGRLDFCQEPGSLWWGKDGRFNYKSRDNWELKIGNGGIEFGIRWNH